MLAVIWLAGGVFLGFLCYRLNGRLWGICLTIMWGIAAEFFFMAPIYSLRVSHTRDLIALALYGTVGLILTTTEPDRKGHRRGIEPRNRQRFADETMDLQDVWQDPASGLAECLKGRPIEIEFLGAGDFRCSYSDAFRILSDTVTAALTDPEVRRISFCTGRRAGVQLLFVDALRSWPPPLGHAAVGRCRAECASVEFPGWPPRMSATSFDNGNGRTYQITLRSLPSGTGFSPRKTHSPAAPPTSA
jgi:hypothetical protein